jgi:hypothetical protein
MVFGAAAKVRAGAAVMARIKAMRFMVELLIKDG